MKGTHQLRLFHQGGTEPLHSFHHTNSRLSVGAQGRGGGVDKEGRISLPAVLFHRCSTVLPHSIHHTHDSLSIGAGRRGSGRHKG